MKDKVVSLDEAIGEIQNGSSVGIGGASMVYKPMSAVRSLVKRGTKDLTVYAFMGDMDVDMLIGVRSAKKVCAAYVGFPMIGLAPNFRKACQNGETEFKEYSELTFILGLRAACMGIPFLPTRTMLGSDLLKVNNDFKLFDCPITKQKLLAIPAMSFDVALLHGYQADSRGNIQIVDKQIMAELIAYFGKSARKTIVTVEKVVDSDEVRRFPEKTILPHYEVDLVVEIPFGAHPSGFLPLYSPDINHITDYYSAALNPEAFKEYLNKFVYSPETNEDYLKIAKSF
nr:CoA-transferase [Candidatus Njordarchaeota archaeon]